tara:strand:- start:1475 stop:1666 length:192 start_codon:yes stop_codon:yes gene_type:complete
MPTRKYTDYYRWGDTGKKYKFTPGNAQSEANAKAKADAQGKAVHASGWSEPKLCKNCKAKMNK